MLGSLISGAISGITSLINGSENRSSQEEENRLNRDWQAEQNSMNRWWQSNESEKARQWEEQMYNLYNSPSAMKRQYQEAGLNPYLAGSQAIGSPMSGSAPMSGAPSSGSPSVSALPPMPDIGRNLIEALGINAQIGNQKANTDKQKWETAAWIYDHFGKDAFDKFADQNDLFGSPSDSQYSQMIASQIFEKNVSTMRNQMEASFLEEWRPKEAQAHIDQINKSLDLMTEQINKLKADEKLSYASAYRVGSEVAKNFAEAGYFKAMSGQINQILPFLVSQYQLAVGTQGMSFISALANFNSEQYVRDWLNSEAGKVSKAAQGFVKGVTETVGDVYGVTPWGNFMKSYGTSKGLQNALPHPPGVE